MPAPKSADVVPGSVVSVVRTPSSFTVAALRPRRCDEDEQTEAEHEGKAEKTEACRATDRDA